MYFWDYGNAFLVECQRAGVDVLKKGAADDGKTFRYPSYMQDIMGWAILSSPLIYTFRDIFSLGFGPFRWVCTSGESADLSVTDRIACEVIDELASGDGKCRMKPEKNSQPLAGPAQCLSN